VNKEAVGCLENGKAWVEEDKNLLRPRNTRPGNKFRLKYKDLVKPDLLEPLVINDDEEDETELPLSSLLVVVKNRKSKHGGGRKLVDLVLKKKQREETLSATRKSKDLVPPPMTEILAQEND